MLQEDYVSFEQAKELKELGFPQDVPHMGFYLLDNSKVLSDWKNGDYDMPSGYYDIRDVYEDEIGKLILNKSFTNEQFDYNDWSSFYSKEYHSNQYHNVAIRPTLSLAHKWLREENGLMINVQSIQSRCVSVEYQSDGSKIENYISVYNVDVRVEQKYFGLPGVRFEMVKAIYDHYDQALSAGIDMAIKILKEKEE